MSARLVAPSSSDFAPELLPGERLLWSGRPGGGVRLVAGDIAAIPFTLMWCAFACFWEWSALHSNAPLIFKLWGIPFVAVGVYMSVGRFFWDAYRRRHTLYGVTDRRVLIVTGAPSRNVRVIGLAAVREMDLRAAPDGAGTLSFGGSDPRRGWPMGSGWPGGGATAPAFEEIADVRSVHETILRAQAGR